MTAPALHYVTVTTATADDVTTAIKRLGLRTGLVRVRRQHPRPPVPEPLVRPVEPPGDGWPTDLPIDQETTHG